MSIYQKISEEVEFEPSSDEYWNKYGFSIFHKFIPDHIIDAYVEERKKLLGDTEFWGPGWPNPTPYMECKTMLDLATYPHLMEKLYQRIHHNEPGLHLCLTGFKSTERNFHSDSYLNPDDVGDNYIAVWVALDNIHPDSGPFLYVPGSHKWPVIKRSKVFEHMKERGDKIDPHTWPSDSQGWVGEACANEILARGASQAIFTPGKGDVLIWNSRLIHKGSLPHDRNLERRALICHYSSIDHRPDMPKAIRNGRYNGYYFPINTKVL